MRHSYWFFLLVLLFGQACKSYRPEMAFDPNQIPVSPDYTQAKHWAALPDRADRADETPTAELKNEQTNAAADVFYLYPTTYTGDKGQDQWNGSVDDQALNEKTDGSAILHQASIFNGAGKIYAPRYRQAHLHAYFTKDKAAAKQAFELAYQDVKKAFQHYMATWNQGRPFIIASHSQGTTHAVRLIQELIDGKDWQRQMVAAYLVGMPVKASSFQAIQPCQTMEQTNCFCSWRSWQRGHGPVNIGVDKGIVVTNPLLWTTDTTYAERQLNEGTVLRKFNKGIKKGITDAQVQGPILWVRKPKFFGRIFITFKNYHVADFNLFYVNVRKNAQQRVRAFLEQAP